MYTTYAQPQRTPDVYLSMRAYGHTLHMPLYDCTFNKYATALPIAVTRIKMLLTRLT